MTMAKPGEYAISVNQNWDWGIPFSVSHSVEIHSKKFQGNFGFQ